MIQEANRSCDEERGRTLAKVFSPRRLSELRENYRLQAFRENPELRLEAEITHAVDRLIELHELPKVKPTKPATPTLFDVGARKLNATERAICEHLKANEKRGATRDELADILGRPIQSICPAVTALLARKIITETKETRPTRWDNPAKVLVMA